MRITCSSCGYSTDDLTLCHTACPHCDGYWELSYEKKLKLKPPVPLEGIRIFSGALPPVINGFPSLGEGNTPLVEAGVSKLGITNTRIFLKNETTNPTGSFKDRFSSVNSAIARKLGAKGIVCASTGNAAMAAVAYSNINGLQSVVFVPETTPKTIIDILKIMGAKVGFCRWGDSLKSVEPFVKKGWFPATGLTSYPVATPFGAEGYKTIAYEIIRDTIEEPPDVIVVPVGGGDLLYGLVKGLFELKSEGIIDRIPTILASQAEQAAPLVKAYSQKLDKIEPLNLATSIATSINETLTGNHALAILRRANGLAITVSDEEIMEASSFMARMGVMAELASSASLAGALKAVKKGLIKEKSKVVCVITGSLLKWNDALETLVERLGRLDR
ncbi:MAG: pyridoxal-phosphate dependent enzyme [Firmicutes bacterium]|nr:pyridoxal-phosphate dependent enzyme [Bacillota bacterium]